MTATGVTSHCCRSRPRTISIVTRSRVTVIVMKSYARTCRRTTARSARSLPTSDRAALA